MRKIHQSALDVPQSVANKAIDIIERHFTINGVRRAEQLPEESKIHLMRELEKYFQSQAPHGTHNEGTSAYNWESGQERKGIIRSLRDWLARVLNNGDSD
ncbi:MAG: hypothetical protein ACYC27_09285 [Armatimonadota bacterium]